MALNSRAIQHWKIKNKIYKNRRRSFACISEARVKEMKSMRQSWFKRKFFSCKRKFLMSIIHFSFLHSPHQSRVECFFCNLNAQPTHTGFSLMPNHSPLPTTTITHIFSYSIYDSLCSPASTANLHSSPSLKQTWGNCIHESLFQIFLFVSFFLRIA